MADISRFFPKARHSEDNISPYAKVFPLLIVVRRIILFLGIRLTP